MAREGIYFEKLNFPHSGTAQKPIVFTRYLDEIVIVDATKVPFTEGIFVRVIGKSYINISGIRFQNFLGRTLVSKGLAIIGPSVGVQILNNEFQDFGPVDDEGELDGIAVFSHKGQHVSDVRISGNKFVRIATGYSEVVMLNGFVHEFEVSDNEVTDAATNPILAASGGYDIKDWGGGYSTDSLGIPHHGVFRNNYIHDNRRGKGTNGIYIDGGRDIIIENNRIINNVVGIGAGCEERRAKKSSNIIIRNNVLVNNSYGIWNGNSENFGGRRVPGGVDSLFIYSNTIVNGEGGLLLFEKSPAADIFVYNNIFYRRADQVGKPIINANNSDIPNFVLDHNLYWTGEASNPKVFVYGGKTYRSLTEFAAATGNEKNGLSADPLFENLPSQNFELKSGSPAIDAGIALDKVPTDSKGIKRPTGLKPDIGAYEMKKEVK